MIDWRKHIHSDETILAGKPVIKKYANIGRADLELLATGWTEETIPEGYPKLTAEDIGAYVEVCLTIQ